jgi:hypothetical protein
VAFVASYDADGMSAAWIGVIGVLGGVVLGAVVNIVGEHLRWQREEARLRSDRAQALEDRRRALAVDFASTVEELGSRLWSFIDYRTSSRKDWRADAFAQAQADRIEAVLSACNRSYNELRILGMGKGMTEAANQLLDLSADATNAAFDDDVDEWDVSEIAEANGDFLAAGHQELGVVRRPVVRASPTPIRRTRPRRRMP